MTGRLSPTLLLILFLGCGSSEESDLELHSHDADSRRFAWTVIASAIKGHGGDAMDDLAAGQITVFTRGHVTPEIEDEIRTITSFQFPGQLREVTEHTVSSSTDQSVYVRNREGTWEQHANEEFELTGEVRFIEALYPLHVILDLKKLNDVDLTFDYVGKVEIDGTSLRVVRVYDKSLPVFELLFDSSTKLIARARSESVNPKTGKLAQSETVYSDYRAFGDLVFPCKMTHTYDGEVFVEKTVEEFMMMDSLPDDLFVPEF